LQWFNVSWHMLPSTREKVRELLCAVDIEGVIFQRR
jgi:hypothetical protein